MEQLNATTDQEVDSLKQDVHDRDEEVRRLTRLLEAEEEVEEASAESEVRFCGQVLFLLGSTTVNNIMYAHAYYSP